MTTFYRRHGKRWLDLALTVPALLLLSPVMGAVVLAVRLRLGAPVLFCQHRLGLHGKLFTILKFRTMSNRRDAHGNLLPDTQRATPLGRTLRRTSLDELPELLNVLKGDMSLVGPRPLLMEYLPYYTDRERTRHLLRPGITGLAQVSGRNLLEWDERLELDVQYTENCSLLLDLRILALTLKKVVTCQDVIEVPASVQQTLVEYRNRTTRGDDGALEVS